MKLFPYFLISLVTTWFLYLHCYSAIEYSQEVYCHYTNKKGLHAPTTPQSIHTTKPFIWVISTVISTITHVPLVNTVAIVASVFPRSAGSRTGPGCAGSCSWSCIWKRVRAMISLCSAFDHFFLAWTKLFIFFFASFMCTFTGVQLSCLQEVWYSEARLITTY